VPTPLKTRAEVVERLFEVFRDRGFEGASMADLAAATGLGKSSLYHAFPGGKDDMARAVLATIRVGVVDEVIAVLEGAGPVRGRLKRMAEVIDTMYEKGKVGCVLGAFSLGKSRETFRSELQDIFRLMIGALAATLREAGIATGEARRRAEDAVVAIQGSLVLACGTGERAAFRRLVKTLPQRLLES
jgi:TetR/AcrR family transcriptional regulator, lmrAB and yxaGH operons repressor